MMVEYNEKCVCGAGLEGRADDQTGVGLLRMRLHEWQKEHKGCAALQVDRTTGQSIMDPTVIFGLLLEATGFRDWLVNQIEQVIVEREGPDDPLGPLRSPSRGPSSGPTTSPPTPRTWTGGETASSQPQWTNITNLSSHTHAIRLDPMSPEDLDKWVAQMQDEAQAHLGRYLDHSELVQMAMQTRTVDRLSPMKFNAAVDRWMAEWERRNKPVFAWQRKGKRI